MWYGEDYRHLKNYIRKSKAIFEHERDMEARLLFWWFPCKEQLYPPWILFQGLAMHSGVLALPLVDIETASIFSYGEVSGFVDCPGCSQLLRVPCIHYIILCSRQEYQLVFTWTWFNWPAVFLFFLIAILSSLDFIVFVMDFPYLHEVDI